MVYLFLMAWNTYGVEVAATFAPEYHNTRRDTALALRSGATFALLAAVLFPLGMAGLYGAPSAATAEGQFYPAAFARIVGSGGASFVTACLIGSLFLSMISSTADASRALYGIARDDMTVKQLYHLNRHHVPGRAMTVDMVVNTLLILFISSNLAILYMSNIGYVIAHILALSGFLLLRRDRPNWPRPIKVGGTWVGLAVVFLVVNLVFLVYGVANPTLTGYGTSTDLVHRRRGACRVGPALPVPAHRPGQASPSRSASRRRRCRRPRRWRFSEQEVAQPAQGESVHPSAGTDRLASRWRPTTATDSSSSRSSSPRTRSSGYSDAGKRCSTTSGRPGSRPTR